MKRIIKGGLYRLNARTGKSLAKYLFQVPTAEWYVRATDSVV